MHKSVGERAFPGVSPGRALGVLRQALKELGVEDAWRYRTHDFRRGHADDLCRSGMFSTQLQHSMGKKSASGDHLVNR